MKLGESVLCPSLLSADFSAIGAVSAHLADLGARWMHLDLMDGQFVNNWTFGPPLVKALRKDKRLFLDAHVMAIQPERWVDDLIAAGADLITVHLEALSDVCAFVKKVQAAGVQTGLAIRPGTAIDQLELALEKAPSLDWVLLMSVEPGFGGQTFLEQSVQRLESLAQLRSKYSFKIQIDGGILEKHLLMLKNKGAQAMVLGSTLFKSQDLSLQWKKLEKLLANCS